MKSRAQRRKDDYIKACRKQQIVQEIYGWDDWYNNLHQYSKNKIHCSCPMCAAKTNPKRKRIAHGYTISDRRKLLNNNVDINNEYDISESNEIL